jgi:hypothetical protein
MPGNAAAQQTTTPGLQIQEIESGWVIAPDARFTRVNDKSATLTGVYGGWLTDKTVLIGGGAYWLTNQANDFKMHYAGGLVRVNIWGHRTLGLSTGAFVGLGDATLSRPFGDVLGNRTEIPEGRYRGARIHDMHQPITTATRLRVNDDFVVAEPQLNALWNITPWLRLDAGGGYRFIGESDLLGRQLRGPSASVALQFGGR